MRIRQIVLAAHDLSAGRAAVAQLLQLAPPFRDPGVAEFGIDNAVFAFGDQFIEVISPTRADSACGRHLARHGEGGYMLILQTDDLQRERERLAGLGVRSVWSIAFDDIAAMHLHPKDVGAAILSLDEPRPPASWRWGGPDWRVAPGPAGRQRVVGVTLRAADPLALAARWSAVLGLPAPRARGGAWRLVLDEGFIEVEAAAPGLADGVAGFTLAVSDVEAVLARARAAGLPVVGSQVGLLGVRLDLQPLPVMPAA